MTKKALFYKRKLVNIPIRNTKRWDFRLLGRRVRFSGEVVKKYWTR